MTDAAVNATFVGQFHLSSPKGQLRPSAWDSGARRAMNSALMRAAMLYRERVQPVSVKRVLRRSP